MVCWPIEGGKLLVLEVIPHTASELKVQLLNEQNTSATDINYIHICNCFLLWCFLRGVEPATAGFSCCCFSLAGS